MCHMDLRLFYWRCMADFKMLSSAWVFTVFGCSCTRIGLSQLGKQHPPVLLSVRLSVATLPKHFGSNYKSHMHISPSFTVFLHLIFFHSFFLFLSFLISFVFYLSNVKHVGNLVPRVRNRFLESKE
jgi:hypothetical protein